MPMPHNYYSAVPPSTRNLDRLVGLIRAVCDGPRLAFGVEESTVARLVMLSTARVMPFRLTRAVRRLECRARNASRARCLGVQLPDRLAAELAHSAPQLPHAIRERNHRAAEGDTREGHRPHGSTGVSGCAPHSLHDPSYTATALLPAT